MNRKLIFFDIDGTLFRNSLLIEHYFLLTENNILDKENWLLNVKPLYQKYQNRKGPYEDYLDKASLLYQQNLKAGGFYSCTVKSALVPVFCIIISSRCIDRCTFFQYLSHF